MPQASSSRYSHKNTKHPKREEMKPTSSFRNETSEKMLRRREWKLEQERQRQHEKLKQKKIYEYEMQRFREKGLLPKKPPNCSKSRSTSPRSRPRRPCTSSSTNTPILSERLESTDGTVPLFKGPEGTKVSAAELCSKVDIQRNILGKSTDSDLQRDIINPEDVVVKRRAGEGLKPIFAREEFKRVATNIEEVEEHCTVVTVNDDTLDAKSKMFKKRSTSLSPNGNRSYSPRRTLSRHSRDERYYRVYRKRSRDRSRDRRDSDRSRERSRDRRDKDRSREQRVSPPHYFGHIPVPIYYTHFLPSPILMAPLMPIRRQAILQTNPYPPMIRPLKTLSPRFVPPYI